MTQDLRDTAVIVLAAGQGTRMKSRRAKVLHEICGEPMLGHVLNACAALEPGRLVVVVGEDADEVRDQFAGRAEFVLQAEQRGTGHAVMIAQPKLSDFEGDVLVLYGDVPLLRPETLAQMAAMKAETGAELVMLTACDENIPGRIVRDIEGHIARIVEASDASEAELAIAERNTGVYLVSRQLLWDGLASLDTSNQQGELYVTDIVGFAVETGARVEALVIDDGSECMGINTRAQLAEATRLMRRRIAELLMDGGVTIIDPETTYIDSTVKVGMDSIIEPGCVITGNTVIGVGVHIKASCTIEDSRLEDDVTLGPCAHLRPKSHLMEGVKIGNFVEIKNATLGRGTKSAHLTYIGDATVGENVNFGCGSVVVNYDGYEKHHTTVGDGAFIGCNANLVSPVVIESKAFVAAGSTITTNVPTDAIAVARARQRNIEGWVARKEGRAPARKKVVTTAPPTEAKKSAEKKTAKKRPARKKAAKKKAAKKATKRPAKKTAKKRAKRR